MTLATEPGRGRRAVLVLAAAAVVIVTALVAALGVREPLPTASPQPPGASAPIVATPSPEPPATIGPPPSPTALDQTSPVVIDVGLLDYLPATVNGVAVIESIDEATQALNDPGLPRIATAMDAGVAVNEGNTDLVLAWVVKLRPEAFTDAVYQQWRDSYDEGACAAAGGVLGRAEATIDERNVYITSCVAGLHTYHVWLEDEAILISASGVGEARFGEVLMDNLRVPA